MPAKKKVAGVPAPKPTALPPAAAPVIPDTVYISFSAEINTKTAETLLAVLAEQAARRVPRVYLMLSTLGGQVISGFNLYNVMRAMPFHLITHNVGSVNSIGNVIFLAGQERYACPHSTFMFHGVGFDIQGGVRLEEKLLLERLDGIKSDQDKIASIILERTKLDAKVVKSLFREAQTKDASYARTNGIVHDIREAQIPPGAPILQLVFQR